MPRGQVSYTEADDSNAINGLGIPDTGGAGDGSNPLLSDTLLVDAVHYLSVNDGDMSGLTTEVLTFKRVGVVEESDPVLHSVTAAELQVLFDDFFGEGNTHVMQDAEYPVSIGAPAPGNGQFTVMYIGDFAGTDVILEEGPNSDLPVATAAGWQGGYTNHQWFFHLGLENIPE